MTNDIILFWMQWSWKWTQWKIFAKKNWYKFFETWAELRNITESWSELWNKIKKIIENWQLVDVNIVIEVVENFIKNISQDTWIVFDWIPRNLEQYELFENILKKYWRKPIWVNIILTKDEALNRLLKRFICVWVDTTNNPLITEEECIRLWWTIKKRADDNEEVIIKRINTFINETQPVIEKYKQEWRLYEINWIQSVEEVEKDFSKIVTF